MKVVCINNTNYTNHLTIDKTYEVINIIDNNISLYLIINDTAYEYLYLIINDNGYEYLYPEYLFKSLSEYRIEKINKLLEE
jgi:hypothetical protein